MKFTGKISSPVALAAFAKLLGPFARLTRYIAMVITEDAVTFVVNKTSTPTLSTRSDAHLTVELRREAFFEVFNFKGFHQGEGEEDRIFVVLNAKQLEKTIHRDLTKSKAKNLFIKLTQKDSIKNGKRERHFMMILELGLPCASSTFRVRPVNHEFPMEMVPYRDWHLFDLPQPHAEHVARVEIEKFDLFRAMLDNLKRMNNLIEFFILPCDGVPTLKLRTFRGALLLTTIEFPNIRLLSENFDNPEFEPHVMARVNTQKLSAVWTGLKSPRMRGKVEIFHKNMVRVEIIMDDIRTLLILPHRETELINF